jgi:hypothetical protein
MDILQDFIKTLSKEEFKSYKLFVKRTHNFDSRKDIELFDSIKKHGDETDTFHNKAIYKTAKADAKYYRLKNKIVDDLGVVITNLNHRKPELDVLHLLSIAKIFNAKKQFELAIHYLKLAERKASEKEDFAILEAIYEQMIRLSLQNVELPPTEIIEKRNENSQRLKLLQDLENNLAVLSYEVKTTQNLTPKKAITDWLNQTLKNTLKLSYVKTSAQLRIKTFQNLSRLMLLLNDYVSLEAYLKTCLVEFENDGIFKKETHDIKLQLLVYLCNASFVLNKHNQSLQYASDLNANLKAYSKQNHDQYLFYYYNILVMNYTKTNLEKALDTLLEAQQQPVIKSNPTNYFYVLNNLAITYFDLKRNKLASKFFSQMYISQNYKSFDEIFKFKLSLFELINKIEMQDVDASQKLIGQLEKAQTSIKEKESIKQDSILIKLLHSYLFKYNAKWRPVKKDIEKFITDYPIDERQSGIINYSNWLQEKV